MIASAGTEIGGSLLGEAATGLIKSKSVKAKAIGTGLRFVSGALSSMAAQKAIEGREDISLGRTLAAGAINSIVPKRGFTTRPVLQSSLIGAGMASGESAISSLIDEGSVNLTDVAISGAVGAGLGFGFGKLDERFGSITKRLTGKTAEEIDKMILNKELTDENLNDMMRAVVGKEISTKELGRARVLIERENMARDLVNQETPLYSNYLKFRNLFIPAKTIGKGAQEQYFTFAQNFERAEAMSRRLNKNVDNLVSRNPELREPISRYISGGEMSEELAAHPISGDLRYMRDLEIQSMRELKDSIENSDTLNFLPQDQKDVILTRMQESINKGVHVYDSAQYRAFYDLKFSSKIKEEDVLEELKDTFLRGVDPDDAKAITKGEKLAQKHLDHIKSLRVSKGRSRAQEMVANLPGRFEKVVGGHMPGPLERQFLGEVTKETLAPGQRARFLIRDLIKHKALIDTDKSLVDILKKSGQIKYEKEPGHIELVLRTGSAVDIDGRKMYVPNESADAIVKLYDSKMREQTAEGIASHMADVYGSMVSLSKVTKVVLNPPSYAVNAIGAQIAALSNGVLPNFKDYKRGFKLGLTELHGLYNYSTNKLKVDNPEIRQKILQDVNEMYRLGLGNATLASNEVSAAINNGKIGDLTRVATEGFGKLYSVTDTATRFMVWKKNVKSMQTILKGSGVQVSDERLKKIAAEITNDTYQNYERTSRAAKQLSRMGIMPPFVTFALEMTRNMTNQVRYINMMRDGDAFAKKFGITLTDEARKKLAAEGRKRAAYFTSVVGFTVAAPTLIGSMTGALADGESVDPDKMEDYRFFLPEYARDKDIVATFNPKTKNGTFAMTSYLLPNAVVTQPLVALLQQGYNEVTDQNAVRNGVRAMLTEMVGEGTFVNQSLFRAIDNRDMRGETISDREGAQKFVDLMTFFAMETFEPGALREAEKFMKAFEGSSDFTPQEVFMRQLGLRFQKTNFDQMAKFRIQDFSRRYSSARGKYTTNAKYKNLTPEDLERSYRDAVQESQAAFERVQEAYNRLDSFGYTSEEKIKILREGNVKSSDIYRIVRGMPFKPFPRGVNLSIGEEYSELFSGLSDRDVNKSIAELRSGSTKDRLKAKRFQTEFRRRKNDERRGRSEEDKLLMNMSIAERAEILKEMNAHRDRKLMNEFKRKGVINKDVNLLLK